MSWIDDLAGELSAEGYELSDTDRKIMNKYANRTQFAKASLHAHRRIGSSFQLPTGEGAERTAQIRQILSKLDGDDYGLVVPTDYPKDLAPSKEDMDAYVERLKHYNILPFQARGLFNDALQRSLEKHQNEQKEVQAKEEDDAKKRTEAIVEKKKSLEEAHGEKLNTVIQNIRLARDKYGQENVFDKDNQPTDDFYDLDIDFWSKVAGDTVAETEFAPGTPSSKSSGTDYSKKYPNSGFNVDGTVG